MSRRPLFATTSDWHLQAGAWKRANTPKGDAFYALRQIYKVCYEREVDLLGAGDLFDDLTPSTAVLERAFGFLGDMQRIGRHVYYTQGQHEKAYPPYLSLHQYPTHLHRRPVTARGVALYGMDHVPADQLEAEAAKVPGGVDVLLCHQVWSDFMGVGAEGSLDLLLKPGGASVILTGDYHDHRVLDLQGTTVCSPGSTCLQSIDEPRDKAIFILYDDLSVESVPLKTRGVVDLVIETQEQLEDCLARMPQFLTAPAGLPEDMRKNVISVECREIDQAYKRVARAVGDRGFLFWKALAGKPGDTLYDDREAARAAPRGLEGCLPLVTDPGGPVYNSVLRLLRAPNKATELIAMSEEFNR